MKEIFDSVYNLINYFSAEAKLLVLILCIAVFFALAFFLGSIYTYLRLHSKYEKLEVRARADAVKRSRAVTEGLVTEQLAPFLPDFPCNPADVRFVGKPVDFIAFPGAYSGEKINEILLIEVKSGNSKLSQREKDVKSAVENGKIKYIEYRMN